jgi:signal peptidase I
VVVVRFAGSKVMLLKRVVGLEGERVEFRDGKLFVNESPLEEPYVRLPCNWNLSPRKVDNHCVYVVGDNRSMPIEHHYFGQTSVERIMGDPYGKDQISHRRFVDCDGWDIRNLSLFSK